MRVASPKGIIKKKKCYQNTMLNQITNTQQTSMFTDDGGQVVGVEVCTEELRYVQMSR